MAVTKAVISESHVEWHKLILVTTTLEKTLEVLNIEPGFYHNKHVKAMDKKVDYDNKRKMTKEFKSGRNQLSKQKTS